ncbi:hypothetical protein BJ912DRAFT_1015405, partial [Pholiota molesta]
CTSKLYLLHSRLEYCPEGKGPTQITLLLRHYLKILNADHGKSLTRLTLSCHPIALEGLRHTELINNKEITGSLGKFSYEILHIFDDMPILGPAMPLDWLVNLLRSSTGGAGMVS